MDISIIAILFLGVLLLLAGPFLGILLLNATRKRRYLEYRLSVISKQQGANPLPIANPTANVKKTIRKSTARSTRDTPRRFTVGKTLFWLVIVIPSLFMLLVIDSFAASLFAIGVYWSLIGGFYYIFFKMRVNKYKRKFIDDLPNAIDLIVRSLKAGRTLSDAMRTVSVESKGPVSAQFKSMSDQLELGKEFLDVSDSVSRELNIPEFSFFVLVLSVQQETGGNVIKTLSSLADMLRQRQLMRLKVKALASEGIFSAFLMGGLPFIVAGLVALIRPEYMAVMFADPLGQHLLIAGMVSEAIGCIVIARMVRIQM
jgi:tight adherence protein B